MNLSTVRTAIQDLDRGLRARNNVSALRVSLMQYHAVLRHLEPILDKRCIDAKRVTGRARKSQHSRDICASHAEVVNIIQDLEHRLGFF